MQLQIDFVIDLVLVNYLFLFCQRNRLHQVTVEVDRVFPEVFCFSLCKEVFTG